MNWIKKLEKDTIYDLTDTTDRGGNPYILHCLRQKDFDRL